MIRVLVTGGGGFVGTTLCPLLAQSGYVVRAALRTNGQAPSGASETVVVGDIGGQTDWTGALRGVDLVIHLAARAHVMTPAANVVASYFETNAHGTRRLAQEAGHCGVRRFIYLSSVKVNGEETLDRAYAARDVPCPQDAYGKSKWEAEQSLLHAAVTTGVQPVIVRSPLVYGPGVRANFLRLLRWVDLERPLPLGAIDNRRSLVSVWSLCDFLIRVLDHPLAANETWMVSDGEDVSTPELVRRIAIAMHRRPRLLPVPIGLLRAAGALLGKGAEIHRLCSSLTVDLASTRDRLSWSPPLSMNEALARTVSWYQSEGCLK